MSKTTISAAATGLPSRRLFLAAGSASAVMGALATAALAEPSELSTLIEQHRRLHIAFNEICGPEDETPVTDPTYPAIKAEYDRLDKAEEQALTAVCACRVRSLDEARIRAKYLANHLERNELQEYQLIALLHSFSN